MTDPPEADDDAATLLTEEELEGLIPSYITLRDELNLAEQENILEAQEWAFARKRNVLDEKFLNNLHKRMFGNVWYGPVSTDNPAKMSGLTHTASHRNYASW